MQLIKIEEIKLEEILNPLPSNLKDVFMSTYDMIIEKGIKNGHA